MNGGAARHQECHVFTLIVCSVNRFDRLARLFASLKLQTFQDFEVTLVDQNPDDRLVPIVADFAGSFKINHIRSPKGLSLARNRGIAVSKAEFVAFPDDDCWYQPTTLENVVAILNSHPAIDVATGRTLDDRGIPSVSPTGTERVKITRSNYLRCGNSNAIFLRRQVLDVIGGFDERLGVGAATPFQSGEEADLLLRALGAGRSLVYFPEILVHHDQIDEVANAAYFERARKYGRGFGALLRKQEFGIGELAYRTLRPFARALLSLACLRWIDARYKWAWFLGTVEGYASWKRISGPLPFSTASAEPPPQRTGAAIIA
jgi:GT2 family glycosyltransferase